MAFVEMRIITKDSAHLFQHTQRQLRAFNQAVCVSDVI